MHRSIHYLLDTLVLIFYVILLGRKKAHNHK